MGFILFRLTSDNENDIHAMFHFECLCDHDGKYCNIKATI